MAKRQSPPSIDVSIERDSKQYAGCYVVDGGVVRVTYFGGTAVGGMSKATQVGSSSPERIARMLLAELVGEHG